MVNKFFLERIWESFLIKPIILVYLIILLSICSLKFSLESNTKPKCFWLSATWIFALLKWKVGYFLLFRVLEKHTSRACLFGSGLKNIFHGKARLLIFARSKLVWEFELPLSFTFHNKYVSLAKILHFEVNLSGKSLI